MSYMETIKTRKRRKVIDLSDQTFRSLSMMAAGRGTNLKHFIETRLDEIAEAYDDAALYNALIKTDPEGMVIAAEPEADDFNNWLGV